MIEKQPLSMMNLGEVTDLGPVKFTPPPVEWERDLGLKAAKPEAPKPTVQQQRPSNTTYWQPIAGMR